MDLNDKTRISAQGKVEGMFQTKVISVPWSIKCLNVYCHRALTHLIGWRQGMWSFNLENNNLSVHWKDGNVLFNDLQIAREETRCRHMGYSFRLAAMFLLYASFHRQDNTFHGLCYTSRGALAGTRSSSMGPPWRIDLMTHRMCERSYHGATPRSCLFIGDYNMWLRATNVL